MKPQRFFIIDYETTGLDIKRDSPIEIGIVITDQKFNLIETYTTFIQAEIDPYDESWLKAYAIHKIEPSLLAYGKTIETVKEDLIALAKKHTVKDNKPILLSDNIQFEWQWTEKIMTDITKYFHYCGWDSSLLLESTGVGDPPPAHRALKDAGLVHAAILKALERVKTNG